MSVLTEAREIVNAGWHQGDWTNGDHTKFCAMGAIGLATTGDVQFVHFPFFANRHVQALQRHLEDVGWTPGSCKNPGCDGCRSVAHFNDHPETTKADVLALFDKAIAEEA